MGAWVIVALRDVTETRVVWGAWASNVASSAEIRIARMAALEISAGMYALLHLPMPRSISAILS